MCYVCTGLIWNFKKRNAQYQDLSDMEITIARQIFENCRVKGDTSWEHLCIRKATLARAAKVLPTHTRAHRVVFPLLRLQGIA